MTANILVPLLGPTVVAAVVVSAIYVALRISPTVLFCFAMVLEIFSGFSDELGFPIGPDRLLFAGLFAMIALGISRSDEVRVSRMRMTFALGLLIAAMVWVTASALIAGTFISTTPIFVWLDRMGVVPILAFVLAPQLFRTREQRNVLLVTLVGLGLYLGVTALLEMTGNHQLLIPPYISDSSLGIHVGRARGPFLDAVAMGFTLFACGVAAAIARSQWKHPNARGLASVTAVLCGIGIFLTLTRAAWLGAVVGAVVALLMTSAGRRILPRVAVGGVIAVVLCMALIPDLSDRAEKRREDNRPVLDRYNTNTAAVAAIKARAFTGVGFQNWGNEGEQYLRQADTYPLTSFLAEIHNVPLSRWAELGIIGGSLWLVAVGVAIGGPCLRRKRDDLEYWRVGLIAVATAGFVMAQFGPFSAALPTLLLFTWAGMLQGAPEPQSQNEEELDIAALEREMANA